MGPGAAGVPGGGTEAEPPDFRVLPYPIANRLME